MSTKPQLAQRVRTVVTGPVADRPATAMPLIVLGGKREPFSEPPFPDLPVPSAATMVVDAFASVTLFACLAGLEAAMLPLRLATVAWDDAAPPITGPLGSRPGR